MIWNDIMADDVWIIIKFMLIIALLIIIIAIFPGWFGQINSHELTFANTTGVFH
jgi:hypothetical protein